MHLNVYYCERMIFLCGIVCMHSIRLLHHHLDFMCTYKLHISIPSISNSSILLMSVSVAHFKTEISFLFRFIRVILYKIRILLSVVGIATGYGLDDRRVGVPVPVRSRIFSTSSRPALGSTQPPIQGVPEALSPGGKVAGA
jgi:hypothetical protein